MQHCNGENDWAPGVLPMVVCSACGARGMYSLVDLGELPAHVGVRWPTVTEARACPRGRVHLAFCDACGFVTNIAYRSDRVDYAHPYDNALEFSAVFQAYERSVAERLIGRYGVRGKRVLEIGCGSGSFLQLLCEAGDNCGIGFDPSMSAARTMCDGRVQLVPDYYPGGNGHSRPDLVVCRQVFEHIPSPREFLRDLRHNLATSPDAVLYFEVPNLADVLQRMGVWTIVYEHCSYFSTDTLTRLFDAAGFDVCDAYECYDGTFAAIEARVKPVGHGRGEVVVGRSTIRDDAEAFISKFEAHQARWCRQLARLAGQDSRTVAWGAGARAVSFFNMLGIAEQVPYVVDVNPRKAGSFLPGTGQQVVAPEFLSEYRPDHVIIMNDLYREEIAAGMTAMGLQTEYLSAQNPT